jgi:hypothetical protein
MRPGRVKALASIAAFVICFGPIVSSQVVHAQDAADSLVFTPDSKPYGVGYPEWTTRWWTWFISSPTDVNPINDDTGARCNENQSGPVWFLVGSGGGKAERSCTIPAGKAILIPNIIIECSFAEDQSLKTLEDLDTCAKDGIDITTDVWTTIDGVDLPDSQVYRIKSEPWNFTFGEDNVFAAPSGPTTGDSDGFWTMIMPLSPGNHKIHVGGLQVDYTVTTPANFIEDSTYNLIVAEATTQLVTQTVMIDGEPVTFEINSTSTISNFRFDQDAKSVSFNLSEDNSSGTASLPIGRLLNGPYTVTINGNAMTDFQTYNMNNETWMSAGYNRGTNEIIIVGASIVPEFPVSVVVLLPVLGITVLVIRRFLFSLKS